MQLKRILAVLSFLTVFGFAAHAQVFDFTLMNKTGETIDQIHVTPADRDDWGDDVLGVDSLDDGESVHIKFSSEYEQALLKFGVHKYDLRIVKEDGKAHVWHDIELEAVTDIEISLDDQGKGVAKVK